MSMHVFLFAVHCQPTSVLFLRWPGCTLH